MTLSVAQGTVAKSTGGNGTTQAITVGFQPKVVFLWGVDDTTNNSFESWAIPFFGMWAEAAGQFSSCISSASQDAAASSNTARMQRNDYLMVLTDENATDYQWTYMDSVNSTQFILNHEINDGRAIILHYLVLGGDDILDTELEAFDADTATGDQTITLSPSFQPNFVMFLSANMTSAQTVPQANSTYSIGMATGATEEACIAQCSEDGRTTMDTKSFQRTDRCIAVLIPTTGALDGEAEFTSFNSNGFSINWINAPAAAIRIGFLAIRFASDATPFVGNGLQPTSNQTSTYSTVSGQTPRGVLMFSRCAAASANIQAHARMVVGSTDGTNESTVFAGDQDAVGDAVCANRSLNSKAISLCTENATATSSVTDAEADFSSFNSGDFRLAWTTTDATQRQFIFVAFSEAVSILYQRTINEGAVSFSDTLSSMRGRTLTESALSIVGDLSRSFVSRTITESGVGLAGALVMGVGRTIIDSAISFAADLVSLFRPRRTINESSVVIDDDIDFKKKLTINESSIGLAGDLLMDVSRTITDSAVSLFDELTSIYRQFRTISESAVSFADSILMEVRRIITESSLSFAGDLTSIFRQRRTINEPSISFDDDIDFKKKLTINESSVGLAGDLLMQISRTITEPAKSFLDSLTSIFFAKRTINESAFTTDDDIDTVYKQRRTIDEDSVSFTDDIDLKIKRILSEAQVIITDSISTGGLFTAVITESALSFVDSILLKKKLAIVESAISALADLQTRLLMKRTINESSVDQSDSIDSEVKRPRTINESTFSVQDSIQTVVSRIMTETELMFQDTLNSVHEYFRVINEASATFLDTLNSVFTAGSGVVARRISQLYVNRGTKWFALMGDLRNKKGAEHIRDALALFFKRW